MLEDDLGSKVVMCCCILKFTSLNDFKGEKVMNCFPLKSFVKTMIVFNLIYFVIQFGSIGFAMTYAMYDIWYFYVSVIMMVPGIIGAFRMIDHLHNEHKKGLNQNFEFAAYSVLAMLIWNLIYINYFYTQDQDLTAFEGFVNLSVTSQVVGNVLETVMILAVYIYFAKVAKQYETLIRVEEPRDQNKDEAEEEVKQNTDESKGGFSFDK